MKEELFELLPKQEVKKAIREDTEIAEEFFKNNKELRNAIAFEEEGVYSVSNDVLKRMNCPIKRKNGKDYWEAFFIFLGFEYYKIPRTGKVKLIIR